MLTDEFIRAPESGEYIYSVSEIADDARRTLEGNFPAIWISGEISNFVCPSSGHWYFTLKDAGAQIRTALFRQSQQAITAIPENGMQVLLHGKISLYTPRGDFQIIADYLEPAGFGNLQRAFEQLKNKLQTEGLFKPEFKKNIPAWPQCIGIITSPTGAAVRDIITVLKRRCQALPIIIYPTLVQGQLAADQIVAAIAAANQHQQCDVLLLSRGGGSLEDLWPFNEERVARAIFASKIPIVSAVGHEIDYTIADFVADQRAPTPSAGAELLSPDIAAINAQLLEYQHQMCQRLRDTLRFQQQKLYLFQKQLQHPLQAIHQQMQKTDYLEQKLQHTMAAILFEKTRTLQQLQQSLQSQHPIQKWQHYFYSLQLLQERLQQLMMNALQQKKEKLQQLIQAVNQLNPLATLARGFAIVSHQENILRDIDAVNVGDNINIQLAFGILESQITQKHKK